MRRCSAAFWPPAPRTSGDGHRDVTVIVAAIVFVAYRELLFSTLDPEVAEVSGFSTVRIDTLLMLIVAAAILATMQLLGVTLIVAARVIPPTIARMLTNSYSIMMVWSVALGTGLVG